MEPDILGSVQHLMFSMVFTMLKEEFCHDAMWTLEMIFGYKCSYISHSFRGVPSKWVGWDL